MKNKTNLTCSPDYKHWLAELKYKAHQSRLKAAVAVNQSLLNFYWELGGDIVEKQQSATWGDGFLKQLSHDLMAEFPHMKGFSKRNLELIRQWYLFWSEYNAIAQTYPGQIAKQPIAQITQIPWGHNLAIIAKCKRHEEALYYVHSTVEQGWSHSVLTHQIESDLWRREGKAISNFSVALPTPQSDLAHQTFKAPYVFDFLDLTKEHNERELEQRLIQHITKFLLELGAGFAYIGKQVPLQVGERDFFIDLLFYHTRLHCYVVVELKVIDFEPEHAGKLNFYIKTVDEQLRSEGDQPTIGLLLCKSRDRLVAKYALGVFTNPSVYRNTRLPSDCRKH